jgi:hypothetical protein
MNEVSRDDDGQLCWARAWLASEFVVVQVPVASVVRSDSPRQDGESKAHIAEMVGAADIPPIIVHQPTMRVIDGRHRLAAATLGHQDTIATRFFDGTAEEAFVLGVAANITHGLKLTRKDRKAAAVRILGMYPEWSDRTIAATAGLSHPTVAVIRRRCSTGKTFQLNTRLGRDGKARPLTSNSGRQAAAELILADQSTPLREVARRAHVSVGTAHDVQTRLKQGVDPSVPTTRGAGLGFSLARALEAITKLRDNPAVWSHQDSKVMLQQLSRSLRSADEARSMIKSAPQHCLDTVADVAAALGDYWSRLSRDLHVRAHTDSATTPLDGKIDLR